MRHKLFCSVAVLHADVKIVAMQDCLWKDAVGLAEN